MLILYIIFIMFLVFVFNIFDKIMATIISMKLDYYLYN